MDLSPEKWHELFVFTEISYVPINSEFHRDKVWPHCAVKCDCHERLKNRVAPALIATGFFDKTPYKAFCVCLDQCVPWERDDRPIFTGFKGQLWAQRKASYEDFGFMTPVEYLDFQTGIAAEAILAACNKYNLDAEPARALANQYPISKIEFSRISIKYETIVPLIEPADDHAFSVLTNKELVFTDFDNSQWCINPPFTERELSKIGPDTLSVRLPDKLLADTYVEVANLMLQAPKAMVRFEDWHTSSFNADILQHFRHVRRVAFEPRSSADLEALRYLSPDLICLELNLSKLKDRLTLEPLRHFKNLQWLRLRGQYVNLSHFPNLRSLRALMLTELSIKNLLSLTRLNKLQSLVLGDCNVQDLSAISKIGQLKFVGLARLPKITHLEDIKQLKHLESLDLLQLNKAKALPSFKELTNLRRLRIVKLKQLVDLFPLAEAPKLDELILFDMKQLKPEHVECLRNHPTLTALRTENVQIELSLGLPRLNTGDVFQFSEAPPVVVDINDGVADFGSDEDIDEQEEDCEEFRVHIQLSSNFGESEEFLRCNKIEERLEEMLADECLGRWFGQECGAGYYTIFFVGPDSQEMYAEVKPKLKKLLPKGSFVEIERADGEVMSVRF